MKTRKERFTEWLLAGISTLSILSMAGIVLFLLLDGLPFFKDYPLTDFLFGLNWYPTDDPMEFGILPLIDRGDGKRKWLFTEANCLYRIGEISREGKIHFHSESRPFYFGRSNNAYAGQFFHNAPDGRAIFIAWQRMPYAAGSAVTGSMTLPVEATLRNNTLHLAPAIQLPGSPCETIPELPYSVEIAAGDTISGIRFGERRIVVNSTRRELAVDGVLYRLPDEASRLEGTLFVDRRSIEFYDRSGTVCLALGEVPQTECILEGFRIGHIRKLHTVCPN